MTPVQRIRPFILVASCALAASCSLSTPYPGRALYTLNVAAPSALENAPPPKPLTLRVRRFIALEPFNTENFIYRTGANSVTSDYYNTFAAPPAELLTSALVQYLRAAHTFETVADSNATLPHQWVLEGRLQDLSVDVTDAKNPQAVLTLQVVVMDESGPNTRVLMDNPYTQRVPISSSSAPNAAAGWSTCAQKIFQQLTTDLAALSALPPTK
jgi:ABC-type uncharacterized transport system auxiliary subunit